MEQVLQDYQQLLHKLAVTRHYLHLFEAELSMIEQEPSLLEFSVETVLIKPEIDKILEACQPLKRQEEKVQALAWYDEPSFRLMNESLDVVGDWLSQLAFLEEVAVAQPFFYSLLDQDRAKSFGILVDLFGSLQVAGAALKEEYERPYEVLTDQP
ncbi:hypothetical protein ACVR0A_06465 [Streptococcus downei]|uniref:Uncharacterized protein n=1 Tax=Streptococcus downei MFe28 TaxID=764290 RepID=A0A380JEZ4_STRDO|nr:hypothetical protein [Streptococcus downei]EFQ57785.1 hypothetical protein HMPREF9176_1904 [Streptococcus downei F0415]SUN36764.1 Uncharacterised protein [Streptococcus downei MFe28]